MLGTRDPRYPAPRAPLLRPGRSRPAIHRKAAPTASTKSGPDTAGRVRARQLARPGSGLHRSRFRAAPQAGSGLHRRPAPGPRPRRPAAPGCTAGRRLRAAPQAGGSGLHRRPAPGPRPRSIAATSARVHGPVEAREQTAPLRNGRHGPDQVPCARQARPGHHEAPRPERARHHEAPRPERARHHEAPGRERARHHEAPGRARFGAALRPKWFGAAQLRDTPSSGARPLAAG